jgi:predicted nucleic acid-binding protein
MHGVTFDTAALIALERGDKRMRTVWKAAADDRLRITAPAAVIGEWWRGRTDLREQIVAALDVEPMTQEIAQAAGEALAAVRGSTLVDAIVMVSAARRGDIVYTSDLEDLERLRARFPSVRLLRV